MKIKASEAVPGQWYETDKRWLCVSESNKLKTARFYNPTKDVIGMFDDASITHLPDCTGWDWQPPKPEKRYRAFATLQEWWPHRERWVKSKAGNVFRLGWIGPATADVDFLEGHIFLNDDGTDGEPFGVEITK